MAPIVSSVGRKLCRAGSRTTRLKSEMPGRHNGCQSGSLFRHRSKENSMKIKTLAMIVVSALSLSSTAALADTTTVNGGTVHFKGEVVNAACAVDAGSIDQTVQLGQVRSAKLATAGSTSSAVGFNIQLDDCDTTVAPKRPSPSPVRPSTAAIPPFWPCKTLPLAAQPTSACRSSTIPVRHWHWTAPPSVLRPR